MFSSKKKTKKRRKMMLFGVNKEREYFIENLSMLVAGGMPMSAAVTSIQAEMKSRSMKKLLGWVSEDIQNGISLSSSLESTGLFRGYSVFLIHLGESSGRLPEYLRLISAQEKKSRLFKSRLRSAMMYPVFVFSITILLGVAIAWFILPRLATVFSQMDVDLPLVTQVLIASGDYLNANGHIVIPVFIISLILIIYIIFFFPKTKFIGQSILFILPGLRSLIREVELLRFSYLLGTLLEAGLSVTDSLNAVKDSTDFLNYRRFYTRLEASVSDGNSFQRSFEQHKKTRKFIPTPIQQLIVASEKSGSLPTTLIDISKIYEEKTEQTTKNITVILEPVLLVIVWLGVVSVALAVILPIYSLIGGFNPGAQIDTDSAVSDIEAKNTNQEEDNQPEPTSWALVLDTGLDYLNVREEPSTDSDIIIQVNVGEVYEFMGERSGWYQIALPCLDNDVDCADSGWVLGEYVDILDYAETNVTAE